MPESDAGVQQSGIQSSANNPILLDNNLDGTSSLADVCARVHERVTVFLQSKPQTERLRNVQKQSLKSLGIIRDALERYTQDEISLSYNGGKDCLVLLILYLTALHEHYTSSASSTGSVANDSHVSRSMPNRLPSVYIISLNAFPEVDAFVNRSMQHYHLSLSRYKKSMREAFADYLSDHPNIRAIFVGTRRTDPHGGKLTFFDPTDRGWPSFMRVHPVIDWHYAEIWAFIREVKVEYCELYDMGYTSLGATTDTHPNPALKERSKSEAGVEVEGEGRFRPAYELTEDEEERLGRDR